MTKKYIFQPTVEAILEINQFLCREGGNPYHCYDTGKVESALNTAFYPGEYPFIHGGIARIAGALCYYLVQSHAFMDGNKRTGALTALTCLNAHQLDLSYPLNIEKGIDALADIIEKCAASQLSKEQLMDWFEAHKVSID